MPSKEGINPTLPKEGDTVTVFGLTGVVLEVVPMTPWSWLVKVQVPNGGGGIEIMTLDIPTDYSTSFGEYCWADEPDEDPMPEHTPVGIAPDGLGGPR